MQDVAEQILKVLKDQLGGRWDALAGEVKDLATQCAFDAAALQVDALSGRDPAEIATEKAQIDAQLANLAAGGEVNIAPAFWTAVQSVGGILLKVGLAAVPALL